MRKDNSSRSKRTVRELRPWRLPEVVVLAAVLFVAAMPSAQAAYIDPGSGALVLQAILAGLFGCVFFFRRTFSRVFGFFRGKNKDGVPKNEDA